MATEQRAKRWGRYPVSSTTLISIKLDTKASDPHCGGPGWGGDVIDPLVLKESGAGTGFYYSYRF